MGGMGLKRRVLLAGEEALGRSGAAESSKRRAENTAVVLLYHSTPDLSVAPFIDPANAMDRRRFERQMRWLAEKRRVVSLSSLTGRLLAGKDPEPGSVAITFDDGYHDNLTVAADVCARLELPVTLFLASGMIERGEAMWIDTLFGAFKRATCHDVIIDGARYTLGSRGPRRRAHAEMSAQLLTAPTRAARDTLLSEFVRRLAPRRDDAPRLMMTWDDARAWLARSPEFEVGSHTVDHLDMTATSRDEARRQLCESRMAIEEEVDREITLFSFPYGRADPTTAMLAKEAGYAAGVADGAEPVLRLGADVMRIPRVVAPDSSGRFALVTSGAWPGLSKRVFGRAAS